LYNSDKSITLTKSFITAFISGKQKNTKLEETVTEFSPSSKTFKYTLYNKQVWMYYRSGTVNTAARRLFVFTHQVSALFVWNNVILKVWRDILEIGLHQSIRIYGRNNPAKYQLDLIWNDGASGFFWRGRPQEEEQDQ